MNYVRKRHLPVNWFCAALRENCLREARREARKLRRRLHPDDRTSAHNWRAIHIMGARDCLETMRAARRVTAADVYPFWADSGRRPRERAYARRVATSPAALEPHARATLRAALDPVIP